MKYSDIKITSTESKPTTYFFGKRSEPNKKTGKFVHYLPYDHDLVHLFDDEDFDEYFNDVISDDGDKMIVSVNPDGSQSIVFPKELKRLIKKNARSFYDYVVKTNDRVLEDYETYVENGDPDRYFYTLDTRSNALNKLLKWAGMKEAPRTGLSDMGRIGQTKMNKLQKNLEDTMSSIRARLSKFKY